MSKQRSRWLDYLVYMLVRFFVCVVQAVPLETAIGFATGLAWLAHRVDRRHREVALENLRQAFGDRFSEVQRQAMVRAVYRHFCCLLMEIIHLSRRLHVHNWRDHVELLGGRPLVDHMLSDRPLMIVTGHFGNWEMGGYILGLLGLRLYAVARPLDNPYLDDFLRSFRERTGQRLLAKKGDFGQMQEILRNGGVIATLGDQDAGQRGLFVHFFGRPASTHKVMALLALEFRVPILVMVAINGGRPLRYVARIVGEILPEDYAGEANAVRSITQEFTTALEQAVCSAPDQYFWLHRRWKHQPARARTSVRSDRFPGRIL
jgi:KDO2-lipid IV(A) lauroyltransferase